MVNIRGGENTKAASEASIPVGCVRRVEFVTVVHQRITFNFMEVERLDYFLPFSNPGDIGLFDIILDGMDNSI